ncbi:DUF397 domain-containing protein [Streptomyces sp. NBC_01537]|uniref:DUF397 domain-containing protein n=1 Tax=Streptomyces sp. NBC_01537 TaxID=2903896 RepID=UPI00387093F9
MNTEHEHVTWFKSSYSGSGGGDCVEVAMPPGNAYVRDSKDAHGPRLTFASAQWSAFVSFTRNQPSTCARPS